jgi:hypothetical protein
VHEPHGERTAVSAGCSKQIDLWLTKHRSRSNVKPSGDYYEHSEREMQLCKKLVPVPPHHSRRKQKNGTHRRHSLISLFSQSNICVGRGTTYDKTCNLRLISKVLLRRSSNGSMYDCLGGCDSREPAVRSCKVFISHAQYVGKRTDFAAEEQRDRVNCEELSCSLH